MQGAAQPAGRQSAAGRAQLLNLLRREIEVAQNRLRSQSIPAAFRGMPITLIYIGVLALAIYGFTGHTVIL